MTIGEYVALRQPNVYRRLMAFMGATVTKPPKAPRLESKKQIDRIMREVPGFYRNEKLPR